VSVLQFFCKKLTLLRGLTFRALLLDLYRPTRKVVLVIAACSSALICFLLIIFTSVLFFWCSLCKPKHYNIKQSDCFCVVALVVGKPAEHHIQRLVRSVLFLSLAYYLTQFEIFCQRPSGLIPAWTILSAYKR